MLPPPAGLATTPGAVVIIDPITTGLVLAYQCAYQRGLAVIAVWSDVIPVELKDYVDSRYNIEYAARIQHSTGALDETGPREVEDRTHAEARYVSDRRAGVLFY